MYDLLSHSPEIIRNLKVERQFRIWKQNPDQFKSRFENDTDNTIGVFSLTPEMNEMMWVKYAANHAGFCIEYDARKLHDSLPKKFDNEITEINPCTASLDEKAQMFLVKTKEWAYENEWRIVSFGWNREVEPIEAECVKNIYFGTHSTEENIKTSIQILKKSNPKISLYKAQLKKDKSELDYIEIESKEL